MRSVTVAFYSCVLGLLGMGLRELMWGSEENRCSMTYMFEYPEYRRVQLPRRVANQYPGYGLYLYGEGAYAQETRGLKLSGAPVLFLPGNAGSYKQARSLGSVALRKAERMAGKIHLNVFTVDFREELVALYGGSLQRQTLFLHESIKAILRLYKNQPHPPRSVVLVGHSMGGVVARALFTLPRFDPTLVSLILTQASPHQAPVLALDADLLDFYSAVRRHWCAGTEELRNVTVLSVGGGHRDYQVRSGLTALPCPQGDPSKLSMVTTAVPRTWVSTDHLSIVWCKELVLATVRAFFDLIDPDTRQFTEDQQRRMAVLKHHFIRHSMRLLEEQHDTAVSLLSGPAEAWTEVNTLRLLYSAPKEPRVKYFLFALSGRRKAYSHFHCRSSSLEMSSWLYGCTQMNTSLCVQAIDLSWGTELLPAYKVVTVRLSDLSSVSHLVISASNLAGNQFSVECEWLNLDSRMVSTPVPHVLSLGLTVSDITLNSTGLLHTVRLENFHQVYQAFRITVMSQCKTAKDRLPSVYRLSVPWFREGFFTSASVPSVTEIAAMLHTSRPDNTSSVLLQLHTAPNCQYKVSVRTSFPKVLGQMLRYCGPTLPSYTAVGLLLACERQIDSLIRTGRPLAMSTAVGAAIQPHKVEIPVYLLQLLLRLSWFRDGWSALSLPLPDGLPVSTLDGAGSLDPAEDWSRLLGLVLQVLGAAVAFWGSALFQLALRALSLLMAPLHRPCLSRHCGVLHPWAQVLLILTLGLLGRVTCGALAFFLAFLCYLYRVLRLLMTQRTLKHVLNLAPQQQKVEKRSSPVDEDGHLDEDGHAGTAKSNGGPLLTDLVLQEVTDDLELHLSLSALLTLPLVLITPSMIHWAWSLRYAIRLHPDPCWPLTLPLLTSTILLINCSCVSFKRSKLLVLVPLLLPPLCVAMATFTLLHLYRVTPLLCMALILLLLCSHV